jgi:hypothetical protein
MAEENQWKRRGIDQFLTWPNSGRHLPKGLDRVISPATRISNDFISVFGLNVSRSNRQRQPSAPRGRRPEPGG